MSAAGTAEPELHAHADVHRSCKPLTPPGCDWRLQTWMGHKRIDETMLYVHVAAAHMRELPDHIREAGQREIDPDKRSVAMLGVRGKTVAKTSSTKNENAANSAA
jgi:hypothetical protein